jgi:predicted dehydrogenase
VRAVVVGCGPIGVMHAEAVHRYPAARVVAVCAPTSERRDPFAEKLSVAAFSGLGKALADVDCNCVFIASPDATHVALARLALESNKHVFCEKPLGCAAADASDLSALATQRNRSLAVNYNRRYGFGYQHARRLLRDGEIGELRQCWLQVTDGTPPPRVATRPDAILWTLLTHHFDLINYIAGEVRRLHARLVSHRRDGLIDDVDVSFELRSGATAHLSASYRDGQTRTCERCELIGSHGGIVVQDVTQGVSLLKADCDDVRHWRPNSLLAGNAFYESLNLHIADFLDRLVQGQPPLASAIDAAAAAQLAEAAVRSSQQHAWIELGGNGK